MTHSSAASSCWMLKYLISYVFLSLAITYKNYLRLCFLRYFLVRYLRYLLENGTVDPTLTLDPSSAILIWSPSFPVLPLTLILWRRYSAKFEVIKTLSSTGFEQSIAKLKVLSFFYYFTAVWVFFMVAVINN